MKRLLAMVLLLSGYAMADYVCRTDTAMAQQNGALRAVAGAQVAVYSYGTTTKATLYDAPTGSEIANPVTSDPSGNYAYCVGAGTYTETISRAGMALFQSKAITLGGAGNTVLATTSQYSSIQAAIDAISAAGGGRLLDTRATAYSGAGFTVKPNVQFYAAPVLYTVTSPVVVKGRAGLIGLGTQGTDTYSAGTTFKAADGLNDDVVKNDTVFATIAPAGLARSSNVVTVATTKAHGLTVGKAIAITGTDDHTFETTATVTSVPTATTFTITQTAANATSGGGAVVDNSTGHAWHYGTISNIRIVGNAANQAAGSGLHLSDIDETCDVSRIFVADAKRDGIVVEGQIAGGSTLQNWTVMGNGRHGLALQNLSLNFTLHGLSGDDNTGQLVYMRGLSSAGAVIHGLKSESVAADTKHDPVILLDAPSGATPILKVMGGYVFGPGGTPKSDVVKITGANSNVTLEGVSVGNYTNCVNDAVNSRTVTKFFCDRVPTMAYAPAYMPLAALFGSAGTGNGLVFGNGTRICWRDFGGFCRDVFWADTGNYVNFGTLSQGFQWWSEAGVLLGSMAETGKAVFQIDQVWSPTGVGAVTAQVNGPGAWTPQANIVITRIDYAIASAPPSGCSTFPAVGVSIAGSYYTTSALTMNTGWTNGDTVNIPVTAGQLVRPAIVVAPAGCSPNASGVYPTYTWHAVP